MNPDDSCKRFVVFDHKFYVMCIYSIHNFILHKVWLYMKCALFYMDIEKEVCLKKNEEGTGMIEILENSRVDELLSSALCLHFSKKSELRL